MPKHFLQPLAILQTGASRFLIFFQIPFCYVLCLLRVTFLAPCPLLPAATKLGQGNVFTGVCDSVHGGRGCLPQCMLGCQTPPEQTPPPGPGTHPPRNRQPPPGSRRQHTVNERPVRILLECILVQCVLFIVIRITERKWVRYPLCPLSTLSTMAQC